MSDSYAAGLRGRLSGYLPDPFIQAAEEAFARAIDEVDPYSRLVSYPLADVREAQDVANAMAAERAERDEALWHRLKGHPSPFDDPWKEESYGRAVS